MKPLFRQFKECLYSDLDSFPIRNEIDRFRIDSMKSSVFKKFIENVAPSADSVALSKFLKANEACRDWSLVNESLLDSHLIGEFQEELYRFWWRSSDDCLAWSVSDFYQHGRTGPGSTIGANGTDYYSKLFSSKLTCTTGYLYDVYRRCTRRSPISDHAENARSSDYGNFSVVEGNRLHFVPKTDSVSRVICVEPSLNIYFQMGFKHILERRLFEVYDIDFSSQPSKNRALALEGSRTGRLATIDLSSASDSVSIKMLREFLPKLWVDLLCSLRSKRCLLPDGRSIELHMISSMGNACTFPLETIIFRAILSAATRVHGLPISRLDLAVFGDDIICPVEIAGKVLRLLHILGFSVNQEKTFVEGPFRESCGHDYFYGHDVRPVFIKSLDTQQDRYIAINLLNAWSAKSGIPTPFAVQYLLETVRRNYVPPAESLDAGILVPFGFLKHPNFDRNGSVLYKPLRARAAALRINPLTLKISGPKSNLLSRNPAGLLESFLRGYVRDFTIPIRNSRMVSYSTRRSVTPNWDYIPTDSTLGGLLNPFKIEFVRRRWNFAVYLNFC